MKELLGKNIKQILVDAEDLSVCFAFSNPDRFSPIEYMYFRMEADCCSETYINHITGTENMGVVADVVVRPWVEVEEALRQERDLVQSVTIVTNKGRIDIEFRNSSNGYYGGDIEYAGITSSFVASSMKPVKNDF